MGNKNMLKKYVILMLLLVSCNNKYEIPIIDSNDIFNIDELDYYVLVYLNGCVACRDVKLKISMLDEVYKYKFYYVDLEMNRELLSDVFVSNVGCSSYKQIKIKKTPTLFYIKDGIILEEYVNSDNILLFLNNFVV